jgi:hypothetical protein
MPCGGGCLRAIETGKDSLETMMASGPDYYIIALETRCGPFPWRWEIRRRSEPMGVKLGAGGYPTREAAERAGQETLATFLDQLAREARRK